jgi:hypothetical protein
MLTHPSTCGAFSGWVARGSAPPVAAAYGRGLTSAALVGAADHRSAPEEWFVSSLTRGIGGSKDRYRILHFQHVSVKMDGFEDLHIPLG